MTTRTLNSVLKLGAASFEDTTSLTQDQWVEQRTQGIGGSDAGAIMGLNPWSTPLMVWLSKKGKNTFEGNAATEWGNILEAPIRRKVAESIGGRIEITGGTFVSKTAPFMRANLDGVLRVKTLTLDGVTVYGLGGWECKTTGHGGGFDDGEIPDSYYAQVQHYMATTGLPWFVLSAFVLDRRDMRHYIVPRNEDFIESMIECERAFWLNNVVCDTAPAPMGTEAEARLVDALTSGGEFTLPSEYEGTFDQLEQIKAQIKDLETQRRALEESLKLKMSTLGGDGTDRTVATCGSWKAVWSEQKRTSIDTSLLKQAGLYGKYSKESSYKTLRIARLKGDEK